jgi:hypothetical protein
MRLEVMRARSNLIRGRSCQLQLLMAAGASWQLAPRYLTVNGPGW